MPSFQVISPKESTKLITKGLKWNLVEHRNLAAVDWPTQVGIKRNHILYEKQEPT